jgi:formylglycine-generating enzyme required for sulfatase activity
VVLDSYYIYKTPVTVRQYRQFCEAQGKAMPSAPYWGWKEDHPMVRVSWEEAKAYCAWAGVTLPTEAQWEKAARGTDGRKYPWGNDWDSSKCQCSKEKVADAGSTSAVGSYPEGTSPYGVLDMAGNVWEWCEDWYDKDYCKTAPSNDPPGPSSSPEGYRALRGGAWNDDYPDSFRCSNRDWDNPTIKYLDDGFRGAAAARSR